jgi:hypothetical protein
VRALGTTLRDWVEAEAGATQTPPELAAVVALATLSACVSKKFEVRPGWREPLNTYWLVALDPGNRKSAVFRDAVRPIQDFEQQLTEKLRDAVQAALVKREIKQRELKRAIDKPVFRGSGLLARIFYSLPESTVGRRDACPPPVAALVSERYHRLCTGLLCIDEARVDGELTPAVLNFSREACQRIEQFSRELEPRLGPGCELSPICDWANKLAGGIARVAAVLHLAEVAGHCGHSGNCGKPDKPTAEDLGDHCGYSGNCGRENRDQIEVEAVDRAILIGRYLLTHAQAAFALMGTDPEIENARQLLSWIRSFKISRFTKRDAWQATRGRFKKASELDPPLSLLVEHGYLAEDPQPDRPGQGRKPSPAFTVSATQWDCQRRGASSQTTRSPGRQPSTSMVAPSAVGPAGGDSPVPRCQRCAIASSTASSKRAAGALTSGCAAASSGVLPTGGKGSSVSRSMANSATPFRACAASPWRPRPSHASATGRPRSRSVSRSPGAVSTMVARHAHFGVGQGAGAEAEPRRLITELTQRGNA